MMFEKLFLRVLNRPRLWMIAAAVVLCVVVAGCLVSNPRVSPNGSDFAIKAGGTVVELGSSETVPLGQLSKKQTVDEATGEICEIEDYEGFSLVRDSRQKIVRLEVLSDQVSTSRDITVGSTREEVLSAYPEIVPEEQKVKALWFEDENSIIEFYFLSDPDHISDLMIYSKTDGDMQTPVEDLVGSSGDGRIVTWFAACDSTFVPLYCLLETNIRQSTSSR